MALLVAATGCSQIFGLSDPGHMVDASGADDGSGSDGAGSDSAPPSPRSLYRILTDLQLTGNLLVSLDAGSLASYDGSSSTWKNQVMGTDFSSSDPNSRPTFHGVPGALSSDEFLQFDGNDWLVETKPGWGDDVFHHDTAKLTIMAVVWYINNGATNVFSNHISYEFLAVRPGVSLSRTQGVQSWFQKDDTANDGVAVTAVTQVPTDTWTFSAITVDVTNSSRHVVHYTNDVLEDFPNTDPAYGTGLANQPATLGAIPNGSVPAPDGTRMAMVGIWKRALTAMEMKGLHDAIRASRFPTLP